MAKSLNEFGIREIANSSLQIDDIPSAGADWWTIGAFALTFNCYAAFGSFKSAASAANALKADSLSDLRNCLVFEQRRWRHFGDDPDSETMTYIRELWEATRRNVLDDDRA